MLTIQSENKFAPNSCSEFRADCVIGMNMKESR
jgi:hypothetical protein